MDRGRRHDPATAPAATVVSGPQAEPAVVAEHPRTEAAHGELLTLGVRWALHVASDDRTEGTGGHRGATRIRQEHTAALHGNRHRGHGAGFGPAAGPTPRSAAEDAVLAVPTTGTCPAPASRDLARPARRQPGSGARSRDRRGDQGMAATAGAARRACPALRVGGVPARAGRRRSTHPRAGAAPGFVPAARPAAAPGARGLARRAARVAHDNDRRPSCRRGRPAPAGQTASERRPTLRPPRPCSPDAVAPLDRSGPWPEGLLGRGRVGTPKIAPRR